MSNAYSLRPDDDLLMTAEVCKELRRGPRWVRETVAHLPGRPYRYRWADVLIHKLADAQPPRSLKSESLNFSSRKASSTSSRSKRKREDEWLR